MIADFYAGAGDECDTSVQVRAGVAALKIKVTAGGAQLVVKVMNLGVWGTAAITKSFFADVTGAVQGFVVRVGGCANLCEWFG